MLCLRKVTKTPLVSCTSGETWHIAAPVRQGISHLWVLEFAGSVTPPPRGRFSAFALETDPTGELERFLSAFLPIQHCRLCNLTVNYRGSDSTVQSFIPVNINAARDTLTHFYDDLYFTFKGTGMPESRKLRIHPDL